MKSYVSCVFKALEAMCVLYLVIVGVFKVRIFAILFHPLILGPVVQRMGRAIQRINTTKSY